MAGCGPGAHANGMGPNGGMVDAGAQAMLMQQQAQQQQLMQRLGGMNGGVAGSVSVTCSEVIFCG